MQSCHLKFPEMEDEENIETSKNTTVFIGIFSGESKSTQKLLKCCKLNTIIV